VKSFVDDEDGKGPRTPLKSPIRKDKAVARDTPLSKLYVPPGKQQLTRRRPTNISFFNQEDYRTTEAVERDETSELGAFKENGFVNNMFFGEDICEAYSSLRQIAREASSELPSTEFVVLGIGGHGKSSVVESILGFSLMTVDFDHRCLRPIQISVVHNRHYEQPRFTILKDLTLGVKRKMCFDKVQELRLELGARIKKSEELIRNPIQILIEHSKAIKFFFFF